MLRAKTILIIWTLFFVSVLIMYFGGVGKEESKLDIYGEVETSKNYKANTVQSKSIRIKLYKDKNGYFAAIPPEGWRQQNYPSETIRSKVAFNHKNETGITIRIISGPTPTQSYTLHDLHKENKIKIDTFFKKNFPKGTFSIIKGKLGEHDAIIQRNSGPASRN